MIKKHFLTTFFALFLSVMFVSAQSKTETIPVSGNCGMCKNSIEKAAKKAGVSAAEWNRETKLLTVTYNAKTTDAKKFSKVLPMLGTIQKTSGRQIQLITTCMAAVNTSAPKLTQYLQKIRVAMMLIAAKKVTSNAVKIN